MVLPPKSLKSSWVPWEHLSKVMRDRCEVQHISEITSVWPSAAARRSLSTLLRPSFMAITKKSLFLLWNNDTEINAIISYLRFGQAQQKIWAWNPLFNQNPTRLDEMNMREQWESSAAIQTPQYVRTPHAVDIWLQSAMTLKDSWYELKWS